FVFDATRWLGRTLFPTELQTWFFGTLGYPGAAGTGWDPSDIYQTVYQAMQAPALLIAAAAAGLRTLRLHLEPRQHALHTVLEVLPRLLICAAVIGIPGATPAIGYIAIAWVVNASVAVATGLFTTLLHTSLLQGITSGQDWFGQLVQTIGNGGRAFIVVLIGFIPLLIMFLYAAFLLVLRTIMIGFCVATAPLCLATAAFDTRNRVLQQWLDLLVGAAMTPVVMGAAIAISFTLASSVVKALVVGPVLAVVLLLGGVWMSGKLVHQLTWRHFSHGGALAGFAAGVSAMLTPLHHAGSAGALAEVFGANRHGTNRAVELMKKIGGAARGVGIEAAHTGPHSLRVAGVLPVRPANSAHGAPRITDLLAPAGRAAVGGYDDDFNQRAFSTFARDHRSLVGSLTKDLPHATLPYADRARVAWDRVSPRSRAAFAEDFLSHWLTSDDAAEETAATGAA
ncbi:MAG TPA: type IV secretion system protein, partial [Candidatus Dormibacteraeota bacterium]|nr:type IV secretion system protein [Candidatus Dormibacteraeota bacterium]